MRRQFERESAAVLGEVWTNQFRDLGMKTVSLASDVAEIFHVKKREAEYRVLMRRLQPTRLPVSTPVTGQSKE